MQELLNKFLLIQEKLKSSLGCTVKKIHEMINMLDIDNESITLTDDLEVDTANIKSKFNENMGTENMGIETLSDMLVKPLEQESVVQGLLNGSAVFTVDENSNLVCNEDFLTSASGTANPKSTIALIRGVSEISWKTDKDIYWFIYATTPTLDYVTGIGICSASKNRRATRFLSKQSSDDYTFAVYTGDASTDLEYFDSAYDLVVGHYLKVRYIQSQGLMIYHRPNVETGWKKWYLIKESYLKTQISETSEYVGNSQYCGFQGGITSPDKTTRVIAGDVKN